jgi:ribosomal protein S20
MLQHASNNLKADREIVLAAVQNNGLAFQHASENLKKDRTIALIAVKKNVLHKNTAARKKARVGKLFVKMV